MIQRTGLRWIALAGALSSCGLLSNTSAADGGTASIPARARPAIHYKAAGGVFHAPHASWRDGDLPPREVTWTYPVVAGADRSTVALNAWIRRQSLMLLLGNAEAVEETVRLSDAQVMAFAAKDPDFIESELEQAVIEMGALGIHRTFTFFTEAAGGAHPVHGLTSHLYDVQRGGERHVQDLFKEDREGDLAELYDRQNKRDAHPCEQRRFGWADASLGARDRIDFEYPHEPGQDVECEIASVSGPKVARLLKSPRDLVPLFSVVRDGH